MHRCTAPRVIGCSLQNQVGVVVDEAGQPTAAALTFPLSPAALATSQNFCLAISTEGVHIFDLTTAELLQHIPFPNPIFGAAQQLLAAQDRKGEQVLVAGFRKVCSAVTSFPQSH